MAQEENKELTPEQTAAALAAASHGRVANVDKKPDDKGDDEEHGQLADDDAAKKAADEAAAKAKEEESAAATEEDGDKDDDQSWKEEWISTGNEDADAAIEIMKEAGVKPVEGNEIFKDALETGDLSKVRWDLLEARVGAAKARLVRTGVESYYNNELSEQIKIQDETYDKVGGKDNWTKVQKWAEAQSKKDPAFAKERAEWNKALKLGGFAARAAIDAVIGKYEADAKNSGLNNSKPERGTAKPGAPAVAGKPLSRAQYFDELEAAGGDRAPQSVKDALWARRQAGQQAGV